MIPVKSKVPILKTDFKFVKPEFLLSDTQTVNRYLGYTTEGEHKFSVTMIGYLFFSAN